MSEPPMKSPEQSTEQGENICPQCAVNGQVNCNKHNKSEPQTSESRGEDFKYVDIHREAMSIRDEFQLGFVAIALLEPLAVRLLKLRAEITQLKSALTQADKMLSMYQHLHEGTKSTREMIAKLAKGER